MTSITLAEVRRRLAPGTEFTAEFIGANSLGRPPEQCRARRRVTIQNAYRMQSEILTGPKTGGKPELTWKHTRATEDAGAIVLWLKDAPQNQSNGEAFLRIEFDPAA